MATHFELFAPLTLANFAAAWDSAPFPRHFLNTIMLVTMILAAQLVLCTLAGFAFARCAFPGSDVAFGLVLRAADGDARGADRGELPHHARARPGGHDPGIGLPYMA